MPFSPATLRFLRSLKRNNDRSWFEKNREKYERDLRGPAREFIDEIKHPLLELFPTLKVDYRCVGRIHRDTRFSADKKPYKDYMSFMFRDHAGKDDVFPSIYIGVDSTGVALGCGMYQFSKPLREYFRDRVTTSPTDADFSRVIQAAKNGRFEIRGRDLKKIPRGYDPDHKNASFLLHNGVYIARDYDHSERLFSTSFPKWIVSQLTSARPFFQWMRETAKNGPRDLSRFLSD